MLSLQIRLIRHQATLEAALQGKFFSPLLSVCEAVWNTPFSSGDPALQDVCRRVGRGTIRRPRKMVKGLRNVAARERLTELGLRSLEKRNLKNSPVAA